MTVPAVKPRILVVDDTPQNIRLLDAVLSSRGYDVVPAGSGPMALDLVDQQPPDLILLDILMPGMDGYEVCRRLRADPAHQALPIIMITASGDQEKLKALEAGRTSSSPSRSIRRNSWPGSNHSCGSSNTMTRSRRRPRS
jgi:adenylate cyclase